MLKTPKILICAVSILLLAAACTKKQAPALPAQNPPAPAPQSQQTKPADETANWKVYANSAMGFNFKHPSDWYVNDSLTLETCCLNITNFKVASDMLLSGQVKIQIQRYTKPASQSLEAFASLPNGLTRKSVKIELTAIAGTEVLKSNATEDASYYLPKSQTEGLLIIVFSGNKGELSAISQEIISTFKFTTQASQTSDWKTYTNSNYGFQLTLTDAWKDYKVDFEPTSSNFGAGTLAFKVPTKKTYEDGSNYATPMEIGIIQQGYWDALQNEDGPKPQFLGKSKDGWVFVASFWQDPPNDLINVNFEVNKVADSFKFTK